MITLQRAAVPYKRCPGRDQRDAGLDQGWMGTAAWVIESRRHVLTQPCPGDPAPLKSVFLKLQMNLGDGGMGGLGGGIGRGGGMEEDAKVEVECLPLC